MIFCISNEVIPFIEVPCTSMDFLFIIWDKLYAKNVGCTLIFMRLQKS